MGKYRDSLHIIADILSITRKRARKTRIMYQANLSYKLLCKYMDRIINAGLVKTEDGICYVLTRKGKEFLSRHKEYSKHRRSLEEHRNNIKTERGVLESMCSDLDGINDVKSSNLFVKGAKKQRS
jgi:predicted transcriptional regulator